MIRATVGQLCITKEGHVCFYERRTGSRLSRFKLVLNERVAKRLRRECFCQKDRAGAFIFWSSVEEMLTNKRIRQALSAAVADGTSAGDHEDPSRTIRLTIDMGYPIGWSSTVTGHDAHTLRKLGVTEQYHVRPEILGYRVASRYYNEFPARLTSQLTFVLNIVSYPDVAGLLVVVLNIYPGNDVGTIMNRKADGIIQDIVFWDWEAPGSHMLKFRLTPNPE